MRVVVGEIEEPWIDVPGSLCLILDTLLMVVGMIPGHPDDADYTVNDQNAEYPQNHGAGASDDK